MSGWISVDERLPAAAAPLAEYGEWVLGFSERYGVSVVCRSLIDPCDNYWRWVGIDGSQEEVTHWMPLPEPPK